MSLNTLYTNTHAHTRRAFITLTVIERSHDTGEGKTTHNQEGFYF